MRNKVNLEWEIKLNSRMRNKVKLEWEIKLI